VPEELKVFNEVMATVNVLGIKQVVQLFDFGKLVPNKEGVVLVDVGGGKGHVINEIRNVFPEMKGFVLQDMKAVLDGGVLVDEEVELIPYDFFNNVQPVKGTFNYSSRNFMVTLCLKAPTIFSKPSYMTGLTPPASPYSPISPRP
jgi:O-methyltransferase domain